MTAAARADRRRPRFAFECGLLRGGESSSPAAGISMVNARGRSGKAAANSMPFRALRTTSRRESRAAE